MSVGPIYNHTSDNVAAAGTPSLEVGTAQAGYGASYLVDWTDENLERPSLLNEVTGSWKLHYPAAQRIDCVMIWHNFDAALACSWLGGNTYASPTLTKALTVPAKRGDGSTVKIFADLRSVSGYTATGFADQWLKVSGANSVPIGAKVWCGQMVRQLARGVGWGPRLTHRRPGIVLSTEFVSAAWTYDFGITPRIFRGRMEGASDSDRDAVIALLESSGLGLVVIVPDPVHKPNEAWLVRLLNGGSVGETGLTARTLDHAATAAVLNANQLALDVEEITAGNPEWV